MKCTRCGGRIGNQILQHRISIHPVTEIPEDYSDVLLCKRCARKVLMFAWTDDDIEELVRLRRLGMPFEIVGSILCEDSDIIRRKYNKYLDHLIEKCMKPEDAFTVGALRKAGWTIEDIAYELKGSFMDIGASPGALANDLVCRIIKRKMWTVFPKPEDSEGDFETVDDLPF